MSAGFALILLAVWKQKKCFESFTKLNLLYLWLSLQMDFRTTKDARCKTTGYISLTETVFTCSRSIDITLKVTRRAYRLIFYSSNTNHQKKFICKPLNGKACLYRMYLTCILLCHLNVEPSFHYKCWCSLKNKVSPVCVLSTDSALWNTFNILMYITLKEMEKKEAEKISSLKLKRATQRNISKK